jgi:hypothetical protein
MILSLYCELDDDSEIFLSYRIVDWILGRFESQHEAIEEIFSVM